MAAGDGARIIRNAAYRFHYEVIVVATGAPQSGTAADHTAMVSLASGTFADITPGAETELATNSGIYYIDMTAAEMTAAGAIVVKVVNANATATFDVVATLTPEPALDSGVAQTGGNQTITLRAAATATLNFYTGAEIEIVRGTGAGQIRTIVHYTTGLVATVDRAWATNPDNTSVYLIHPHVGSDVATWLNHGIAAAVASSSITLASTASTTADLYNGCSVHIIAGTGVGQRRTITDYSTGRVATVDHAWITNPDTTSIYIVRAAQGFQTQTDGIPDVNVEYIDANATAASNLEQLMKGGQINGSVNDAAATTTSFIGDSGLSATNDFYNGSYLLFLTGTLAGLARAISDYVGSTKTITLATALPSAPANGVEFVIIGNAD